jgi:hypothetical protein
MSANRIFISALKPINAELQIRLVAGQQFSEKTHFNA